MFERLDFELGKHSPWKINAAGMQRFVCEWLREEDRARVKEVHISGDAALSLAQKNVLKALPNLESLHFRSEKTSSDVLNQVGRCKLDPGTLKAPSFKISKVIK